MASGAHSQGRQRGEGNATTGVSAGNCTSYCRHVSQTDRPSKRYRNVHADVFVIADEDEENGKCVLL